LKANKSGTLYPHKKVGNFEPKGKRKNTGVFERYKDILRRLRERFKGKEKNNLKGYEPWTIEKKERDISISRGRVRENPLRGME